MKIKEIEKTVNTSWSPGDHHPTLLAAGTAAQQLDASFNTSAALEIYALNLLEPSFDLELKLSVPCQQRFHKVVWGGTSPGIIVGGCDNGVLEIFNASKLFANEEGRVASPERHTGPVRSLDFNPYQKNLLATGASSSEIYIWDMNNTSTPMTPGAKSQPFEDVAWLAWNRQVQHILASTFPTRSVVWDLRKSEPIIKLTDTTTRVRWKVVAWHPEVATQLCLASEEDSNPVIQLWDLRFATAPVKSFHGHNRGVLSLAWCSQDPDLLISSGKDNKILCWNPNTNNPEGEIMCEIPNSQQWIFDVSWCPRNPSLIVSSSCDGHTSIYSLTGSPGVASVSNKIADSFPGMDNYDEQQVQAHQPTVDLKKAPKWLRRPVGAKFGFGGRMSTFGPDGVKLFQVHLDEQFLDRARDLERKVAEGRQYEICQGKQDPLWRYLEACYSDDPTRAIRDILGYNEESVMKSLGIAPKENFQNDVDNLNDQFSQIGKDDYGYGAHDGQLYGNREIVNGTDVFDTISKKPPPENAVPQKPLRFEVDNGVEGKVSRALLIGRIEDAINICLEDDRLADALVLACATNPDAVHRIHQRYFEKKKNDPLSRIIQALVTEDWEAVIANCELSSWKEALTGILTYKKDASQLAELLGSRLEQAGGEFAQHAEVCYIASGNISPLVRKRTSGVPLNIDNIQDLVELVLVAQGAMNSRGLQLLLVDDVAKLLGHYSEMLASEGELEVALGILRDCQDEEVEMLKDRLSYALGLKHLPQPHQQRQFVQNNQAPQNMASHFGAPSQTLPKIGKPFGVAPTNQVKRADPSAPANLYSKPPAGPPTLPGSAPVSAQQTPAMYNQPLHHSAGKAPVGVAPPPVGPPSASTNYARNSPSPVTQGASSKKYVVDPSVAGNAPFRSQSAMASPYSQSPGMYGSTTSGYPGSVPAPSPYNFGQDAGYNPSAPSPSYGSYTAAPDKLSGPPSQQGYGSFQPGPQQNMYKPSPAPQAQPSMYNPQAQNVGFKPSVSNLPPSEQIYSAQNSPASGWNDPPLVAPKTSQPKAEQNSQSPITHPLFGTAPPQPEFAPHQHLPPQQQLPQQQHMPQQHLPQQHQGYQNQHLPQQMQFAPPPQAAQHPPQTSFQPQPVLQSQQASHQPLSGYGEPPSEVAKTPEPVKAALPQEFAHVQSTFEDLRNKCLAASSSNPLMRRKLEDVARKLEAMYDCLSYGKLSPSALGGIEQIVQCVQASDFHSALSVITQMVSGSDFSQVSPFMTGVKILLQTAQQLRVN